MNSVLQKKLTQASSALLFVFAFCLPFRIDFLLYTSPLQHSSVGVLWYSSSFLHISEILLLMSSFVVLFLKQHTAKTLPKRTILLLSLFVLSVGLSFLFSVDPTLHFLQSKYLLYGMLLVWLIFEHPKSLQWILYGLLASSTILSGIIFFQTIAGGSVGLSFLGEPVFSTELLTSAKTQVGPYIFARPYGTTDHPNIAAAYLFCTLVLLVLYGKKYLQQQSTLILSIIIVIAIACTMSKAAFLCTAILLLSRTSSSHIRTIGLILTGLLLGVLFFFSPSSIWERMQFIVDSLMMFVQYPMGVGLGSYTGILPFIHSEILQPWEIQPVHNFFLLLANETGIITMIIFLAFFLYALYNIRKKEFFVPILLVTFLASVDHYFLTNNAMSLVFWFMIGLLLYTNESPSHTTKGKTSLHLFPEKK